MPAPRPREFRQRAVEIARQGTTSVSRIAWDLGISSSCLRSWMHQADADDNGGDSPAGKDVELDKDRWDLRPGADLPRPVDRIVIGASLSVRTSGR
jgi:transposase-like protein